MNGIRQIVEQAIRERGVRATARAIGKCPSLVSMFLAGTRDLSLTDVERIQHAFALTFYAPPPRGEAPVRRPARPRRDPPDARAAPPPRD